MKVTPLHGAVSLPQHGFFVGLCLQTAVNDVSKSDTGKPLPSREMISKLSKVLMCYYRIFHLLISPFNRLCEKTFLESLFICVYT